MNPSLRSVVVDAIDEQSKTSDVASGGVELQRGRRVVFFSRVDPLRDSATGDQVTEFLVEFFEGLVANRAVEAEDQAVADIALGMIPAVEMLDLADRDVDVVRDAEEAHVGLGDQAFVAKVPFYVTMPRFPVGTTAVSYTHLTLPTICSV